MIDRPKRHTRECDLADSKDFDLVKTIKLEFSEAPELKNEEKILPDLEDSSILPVNDEKSIGNLLSTSDSTKNYRQDLSSCYINIEDKRKYETIKESILNQIKSTTSDKIFVSSTKSTSCGQNLEELKIDISNKNTEKQDMTICKSSVDTEETADISERNQHEFDENMDDSDHFSESFVDNDDISNKTMCSGNILCDCDRCKTLSTLLTTKSKPEKKNEFICSLCNKTFPRKTDLTKHKESLCNTVKLFFCDHCSKGFSQQRYLKYHLKRCQTQSANSGNEKRVSCDLCDKHFTLNAYLIKHKQIVHNKQKMNITYTSEVCQKEYKHKQNLVHRKSETHDVTNINHEELKISISNKNTEKQDMTISKSSVEMLETEASADISEPNQHEFDENMDDSDHFSESFGDNDISSKTMCSGNILCDCDRCKTFRSTLLTTKSKPERNKKFICILCNKTFPRKTDLTKHQDSLCNTVKLFFCDHCSKGFSQQRYLKKHLKRCQSANFGNEKLVSCDLCDKSFTLNAYLIKHKQIVHYKPKMNITLDKQEMNITYTCEICQNVYKHKRNLVRHKSDSHSDEKFECGHCPNVYPSKDILNTHLQSVHFSTDMKCSECCEVFASEDSLKTHMLSNHLKSKEQRVIEETLVTEESTDMIKPSKQREDENLENAGDFREEYEETASPVNSICSGNIFCNCSSCITFREELVAKLPKPTRNHKHVCSLCNKSFYQKDCLKQHIASKCNTLKLFPCDHCAKGFTDKKYLKYHMRKCQTRNVTEEKLKLSCDLCDKYLSSENNLRRHKKFVHLAKNMNITFTCETCQKVYKNKDCLYRHRVRYHSGQTFECGHCSKICVSKHFLKSHIKSKHFQTQLKCSWPSCDKTFVSAPGLKNHELGFHLKLYSQSFTCETCGKRFSSKYRLQNHLLIHTDEKSFMCQVCGKNFRTESNLEQHSVTHSDKRPFLCDLCPKAFRIKHHLRQHMAVHGMVHTSKRKKGRRN